MTAAQREFHERLRIKHLEIQKSIMAQQEELRRVETELLLAQYGAWGPTVLKVKFVFVKAKTDIRCDCVYALNFSHFLDDGSVCRE